MATEPLGFPRVPRKLIQMCQHLAPTPDLLTLTIFIGKLLGWIMTLKKEEASALPPPLLTKDQELLGEIRDLLKQY